MSLHIPLEDLSAHLDGALTEARAAQVRRQPRARSGAASTGR